MVLDPDNEKINLVYEQPVVRMNKTHTSYQSDDEEEELPPFSPKSSSIQVLSEEFKEREEDEQGDAAVPQGPRYKSTTRHQENSWANDSWRLVLELKKSKDDIKRAAETRRKQAIVTRARKEFLVQTASKLKSQAKVDKITKKAVKEASKDAIEYHKVHERMKREAKRENVQDLREYEATARLLRRGQREAWQKGPIIGPGPHPTEYFVDPTPTAIPFVYDIHGRRHDLDRSNAVLAQSQFDAAMHKIQREAAKAGKHLLNFFKKYDRDRSGSLDVNEFKMALMDMEVNLSNEQVTELFSCFDRNHTGTVDYGEFLWSFFNRRAFLKQWRNTGSKLTPLQLQQHFYKHDSRRRGGLTSRDFFVALRELGFNLSGMDEALLLHKFDLNGDGHIDLEEFQGAFTYTQVHPEKKENNAMELLDELTQVQGRIRGLLNL